MNGIFLCRFLIKEQKNRENNAFNNAEQFSAFKYKFH